MLKIMQSSVLPLMLLISSIAPAATMTMADIIARAVDNASAVERAVADLETARARADSAYTVYAPYVALSGSYSRLSEEELPELTPGFSFPQFLDNYSFQASAQFAVSDYLLTRPALYKIGTEGMRFQEAQLDAARERVAMQAATLALQWTAAKEGLSVAESGAQTLEAGVNDIERLQEAGLATRSDALAIKAQHAAVTTSVIRARGLVKTLALQLGQLIGLDAGQPLPELQLKLNDQPRNPDIALNEALATAIAQRPELRALRKARDLQSYEVDRYFGELFPKLGLVGVVDTANPNQRIFPLVEEYNTTWAVQATLTWSPNDFVIQRSLYKEAQEQLKGLEADLKGLRQAVELELASVISDLETARELCTATLKEQSAAQAALRDQEVLFKAGETTSLQLLEREQANREAALGHIDALVQLFLAEIRLQKSLGDLDSFARKELK